MMAVHRNAVAKTPKRSEPRRRPGKVETIRVSMLAVETALRLAAGDIRRLKVTSDGAILVLNHPRRLYEPSKGVHGTPARRGNW